MRIRASRCSRLSESYKYRGALPELMKALVLIALLLIPASVIALNTESYSKNAFREQMRLRFVYPEQRTQTPVIEDDAFIRAQPRNIVVDNRRVRPPKTLARFPAKNSASPNIDFPVSRRGIFDRNLEPSLEPFSQSNDYIRSYQRRVKTTARAFRHNPVESSLYDQMKVDQQNLKSPTQTSFSLPK